MDEKPEFEEICERYAKEMERRLKERGITEEEFLEECENDCDYQRTSIRIVLTNDNH